MSLRERKKRKTRKRIVDAAISLFLKQGLLETSVTDIALTADISRRTFFHYFPSKDDIVVAWYLDQAEHLVEDFRTFDKHQPIWESLRVAFVRMRKHFGQNDTRIIELYRFIQKNPRLLALKYDFYSYVARELIPTVRERMEDQESASLYASVVIHAAIGAYTAANEEWARRSVQDPFEPIALRAFELAQPKIVGGNKQSEALKD